MIRGFIVSGPRILTVSSRFDILIDDQFARLDIRRSAKTDLSSGWMNLFVGASVHE
jgi:hypothetical protein